MKFRKLTVKEIKEFERYAGEHDPDPGKWSIYHPACRRVWTALGKGPKREPPYPWCIGAPTREDCIRAGYCKKEPTCGD